MVTFYSVGKEVGTAGDLVKKSDRDTREMLGELVTILQRKELLSDRDIATILGISTADLERLPF